jgi:uncharacterized membrane protein YfcA
MSQILILFFTSIIATGLSSMSGGGASVIAVPVMMWMGIPFPFAMSAQKFSSIFWVLPASRNYLKGRKVNWKFLILFSTLGLIGVYIGVITVVSINKRVLELCIGVLILLLVVYTALRRDIGLKEEIIPSNKKRFISYVFGPVLGFYEAVFGSGNGIMFAIVTLKTRGFDFIDALGYYYSVAFPWEILAAGLYIYKGYFSWSVMIPCVIGSVIGGYIGSRYAKYKGNTFIKIMFISVGTILGIKLLVGF